MSEPGKTYKRHPIDTLAVVIGQARAISIVMANGYDDEGDAFITPDKYLRDALFAIDDLLIQAEDAVDALVSK